MSFQERRGERLFSARTVIELAGTPYFHRYDDLIHNMIEDLLTAVIGERIRGWQCMTSFPEDDIGELRENLVSIHQAALRNPPHGILLFQDGPFAGMVAVEMFRKARKLADEEARGLTAGLLSLVRSEDLIVLTLVDPRVALAQMPYPPDLDGYEAVRNKYFVLFTVYNEAARTVLATHQQDLGHVSIVEPRTDLFDSGFILVENARLVCEYLGLPFPSGEKAERIAREMTIAHQTKAGDPEIRRSISATTRMMISLIEKAVF